MGTLNFNKVMIVISPIYQILAIYYLADTCSPQNVSAFFVFGDSLVEVGNNFYIKTIAMPWYPHAEEELGFKNFTPPYLDPTTIGDVVLKGVNYASSGSGILDITGSVFGAHICMDKQVSNFAKTRQYIISRIGAAAAQRLLRQALYFIVIGYNDILRKNSSSNDANYLDDLVSKFRSQLRMLYNLDARKIVVANIQPLGCIPLLRSSDGCDASMNEQAKLYNMKLKTLILPELTTNLARSTFVYVDTYAIFEDILRNYKSYGFENVDSACYIGVGWTGFCKDRTKYVFWDTFHPTETANLIIAKHILDGSHKYVSPMNLRKLVNSQ
ncbi:hypothetical protein REPUB_Repub14bG0089600 [Reevesia pubescens]